MDPVQSGERPGLLSAADVCRRHGVALCYLFGSQREIGLRILAGERVEAADPESDIDFAVLFENPPGDALDAYARLSLDLADLVSPHRADLLFLNEVDHLIQLEAIVGTCIYAVDEEVRTAYEERVMVFAADEMEVFKRNDEDFLEAIRNGYFEFEYKAR